MTTHCTTSKGSITRPFTITCTERPVPTSIGTASSSARWLSNLTWLTLTCALLIANGIPLLHDTKVRHVHVEGVSQLGATLQSIPVTSCQYRLKAYSAACRRNCTFCQYERSLLILCKRCESIVGSNSKILRHASIICYSLWMLRHHEFPRLTCSCLTWTSDKALKHHHLKRSIFAPEMIMENVIIWDIKLTYFGNYVSWLYGAVDKPIATYRSVDGSTPLGDDCFFFSFFLFCHLFFFVLTPLSSLAALCIGVALYFLL